MKKNVVLIHWKSEEAKPLIDLLEKAGYEVHYRQPMRMSELRRIDPFAAVIDLTRLPSRGRYWAAEVRASKALQHLPIVFVDGDSERVATVKAALPDAAFTSRAGLKGVLEKVRPLTDPVIPARMMASDRTSAQKLGIKENARVAVFDPPHDYAQIIGKLPKGASFAEEPDDVPPVTLWFVREADAYLQGLRTMRKLAAQSKLWVVYPKQTKKPGNGITQFVVREAALQFGLVDYKICSVNANWTGMALAVKK